MKGSRYAVIKLIESRDFITNINSLIKTSKAKISIWDNWMPKSLHFDKEAQLKDFLKYNFSTKLSNSIVKWWLQNEATTPNWDLISTCTVEGKRGLLLVEAKAHYEELDGESKGKTLASNASNNSLKNHNKIDEAINEANLFIKKSYPEIDISRDNCYQLSNRIAYSYWLASQGIPVVLLYLGFLDCDDINYNNRKLFKKDEDWQSCFKEHSQKVGVNTIIGRWVDCGESKFMTICKSF